MKQFCPACKTTHDPDVPCYDVTEQLKRDIGIMPPKGNGSGELSQKTIWLVVLAFVVVLLGGSFIAWVL